MNKWVNRFAPILSSISPIKKIADLPLGTVVEATGNILGNYEEVTVDIGEVSKTGWVHTDDLEDYIRNFAVNCVKIENQTPSKHDFEQFIILKLIKQVNMCGELCAAYIGGVSLGTILSMWEVKAPNIWKRIFANGKATGTGITDLQSIFTIFGRASHDLEKMLFQPHIKRSRYTIKGLQKLMEKGSQTKHITLPVKRR